jgi:glycosyltransferase involved in cell wall biosynthesis
MKPEPSKNHLKVISIPLSSQKVLGADADFLGFSHGILQYLKEIQNFNPEIIIVDDWHAASAVIALKQFLNIPLVYQYFRIFCRDPKFIPDPYKYQIVRKLEHDLAQTADLNIHLSKDTARWGKENFDKPTQVLYAPIKPSYVEAATKYLESHPKQRTAPHTPFKFVTFVRISPEKELDRMIRFLAHLQMPWQMKIIGEPVNQEYMQQITELVKQLQLEKKIEFDGRVQLNTLIEEISAADAYIHPARYEPFGISIMEAAFLGLPILLDNSDKIGAGEVVEDMKSCIRLDFEKPQESEQKLLGVIENQKKWRNIGLAGQIIAQGLTVEKEIQQLFQYLKEKQ